MKKDFKRKTLNIPSFIDEKINYYASQLCLNYTATLILLIGKGIENCYDHKEIRKNFK